MRRQQEAKGKERRNLGEEDKEGMGDFGREGEVV